MSDKKVKSLLWEFLMECLKVHHQQEDRKFKDISQAQRFYFSAIKAHYNKLLPKVNGEYQCEHVKNTIDGNCVWCALTVAEKGLKKQRELRIEAEQKLNSRRLQECKNCKKNPLDKTSNP